MVLCLSKGSEDIAEAHQDDGMDEIVPSRALLTGESHKENLMETFQGGRKGEGNSEGRILREMTTKVNQEDMTTRKDIETIKNTNSASSIISLKTEYRDQEDFLPATSGI